MSITDAITVQIERAQQGDVFFVSDFAKSGNDVFISRVLSELVDKGKLDRLAIGIYYKPQSTDFGLLKPSVDQIVRAIARRDHAQVMPTGLTAENRLGLSTQVPMNYVYLTTGSARNIIIGNRKIVFKRCVPKNFAFKGKLMPVLIQAMKSIGKKNVTEKQIDHIKGLLRKCPENETFEHDLALAPIWIKKILSKIQKELTL